MNLLVTGGAGYIGSITARLLVEQNHRVVILDNLSTGFKENVPTSAQFIQGTVLDRSLVERILIDYKIEAVLHFAAKLVVPESVENPSTYYENNVLGGLSLLEACRLVGVKNFIFSSTAAVYGNPIQIPVSEQAPILPLNPYGASKAMVEQMLMDFGRAYGQKFVILRYFNVAGAALDFDLGQRSPKATHLIKVACEVAVGKRKSMTLYGTDYPTSDGTGVRDYIHVLDLAQAHIEALRYLERGGASEVFNCGYGVGYSVRQVTNMIQSFVSAPMVVIAGSRREGDAAEVVADATKIHRILGWQPQWNRLESICRSSLDWERQLQTY